MTTENSALLTDLYQLTMLQTYHAKCMQETAVFELFARRLPPERGFLLAAGLEQVLAYLENLRFTPEELDWLAGCGRFDPRFVNFLAEFRFSGTVHALPEGTALFADEPILRITAPLPQAQLVESRLINLIHYQTLIASKAARCVLAAPGKLLVDFGMRRAHGAEAGLLAARAAYLAGFGGTATVLAGMRFGIPLFGTMAHSLVQAHDREEDAFEHFAATQPDNVVLLIDTYDTEAAARKLILLASRLQTRGITIKGVRIDSGDLAEHARRVRRILDDGGLRSGSPFSAAATSTNTAFAETVGRRGTHRRFRHRHPAGCLHRCADPGTGLQAARVRRPTPAQALRRQGDLAEVASRCTERPDAGWKPSPLTASAWKRTPRPGQPLAATRHAGRQAAVASRNRSPPFATGPGRNWRCYRPRCAPTKPYRRFR
jgi:nicotinic acid phosphoribosyltransferase